MAPAAAMWAEQSTDDMMGVCFPSSADSMDASESSSSDSDDSSTSQDGASSHHLGLKKLRALRRRHHPRKYFDSAEWNLKHLVEDASPTMMMMQELPSEGELPVAWKVLGTKVPQAPVPATANMHNLRYSAAAAPDAVLGLATTTDQASCEAALQSSVWRPASTPTGGQPLAFQHKPSRLSLASA